ncbi:MAG: anti-sigma factor [Hydrogenophaga sp.]|uniref:anti-sigma factor family protein n=1 Tax=Hydrogenophaga sp. TaxID=1904254 RepID=UPI001D9C9492|nr:anti-sigma factor [Hydrogenophaga sp.]MBX3611361.1 anti-sigma factor [Hydrogenophaga sp.]
MDPSRDTTPLSDADIQALIDEPAGHPDLAALRARLHVDTDAQARVRQGRAQRDALRDLHRAVLQEPVPPAMLAAADLAGNVQARQQQWWRWGGMAAGVVLAFGAGWLGRGTWPAAGSDPVAGARPNGHATIAMSTAQPTLTRFAHEAAVAHAVYSPEQRHPVEVGASDEAHLVQWLSKRTGRALKVPDLQALGYVLVGGRLLPGEQGARAQFMYQNPQGVRVTLYLGAVQAGDIATAPAQGATPSAESAFRFTDAGPVPGFYWVDQGFGYALSGPLDRAGLMALADAVYRQL